MATNDSTTTSRRFASFREIADFLWQNAERLRGAYKPNEYDKVILPLLVIRRLDCVLEPTKEKVLKRLAELQERGHKATDPAVDVSLRKRGIVRTLFDPACGTGGMLSVAEEYLRELNPQSRLEVFGQDLNDETYAICKSDMMIKGQNPENIVCGDAFAQDGHGERRFDSMLSNPPFGVDWKHAQKVIEDEHEKRGHAGRFGAGLPRISDGALLFLQHMLSKMKPVDPKTGEGGSRIGIVFNGSPLFSGDAGSGESEIRRCILENDWLEAIVALPDQLFYNTGISTYVWILSNRKPKHRKGKVQLINATELYRKMRKSLGNKRNELAEEHIERIAKAFGDFEASDISKIFDNEDFGYRRIVIERPLRLNFQASRERIARLREESGFQGLAKSNRSRAGGARVTAPYLLDSNVFIEAKNRHYSFASCPAFWVWFLETNRSRGVSGIAKVSEHRPSRSASAVAGKVEITKEAS